MSKNTANTRFRKVNVDEYNEDNFCEDDVEDGGQGPNEGEVQSMLTQYPFPGSSPGFFTHLLVLICFNRFTMFITQSNLKCLAQYLAYR